MDTKPAVETAKDRKVKSDFKVEIVKVDQQSALRAQKLF
jgi:hypothetical protein